MVFKEVGAPNQKVKCKTDLEEELGLSSASIRENEGEAALHGIFYDDSAYDYMQHMRDLGAATESCFVEAVPESQKWKQKQGKGKQRLEDALRDATINDDEAGGVKIGQPVPLLDADMLPSKRLKKSTYQDQQDVPDALAGFQPDMDPRLREVLEALEDEAYVDDEEEMFGELAKDGEEVSMEEFESADLDEDLDDGWATDDTTKPEGETSRVPGQGDTSMGNAPAAQSEDWMTAFGKFKEAKKSRPLPPSSFNTGASSLTGGRRKKRKGAMTSSTGYSMTSSALHRTEGLTLLDDRFDKVNPSLIYISLSVDHPTHSHFQIEAEYAEDADDYDDYDDGVSLAPSTLSNVTSSSQAQQPLRSDFDAMMDDFLGSYSMSGKKRVKKGGYQSGLEQLEEIVS